MICWGMFGNGVPMYGTEISMALRLMEVLGSKEQINNLVAPCEAVHGMSIHFDAVRLIAVTTIENLRQAALVCELLWTSFDRLLIASNMIELFIATESRRRTTLQ